LDHTPNTGASILEHQRVTKQFRALSRDGVVTHIAIGKARNKEEAPSEELEVKNVTCTNRRAHGSFTQQSASMTSLVGRHRLTFMVSNTFGGPKIKYELPLDGFHCPSLH
jgi:hypothetical protein